jgi:hypothetical protein
MSCACLGVLMFRAAGGGTMVEAADWADSRVVGPIVCRADFSLAGMEPVLKDLASLQTDLVNLLDVPTAKEPIELYLFHDKATYAGYLNRYLPNVPYRRALYVKNRGPGRVFAYWSPELDVDLRHECIHALLHASLPVVPLWLDEGLAQYFEAPAPQRVAGHPHMDSIRRSVRWNGVPSLEALEKKANVSEMGQTEYRDSWAWVHFMLLGPREAHEELKGFLADIHHGTPPGQLSARIQRRLPQSHEQFSEHFQHWPR